MILGALYIAWCSAKNRVIRRLRRLREPRYFFGALVGVAYLYFAVFQRFGQGPRVNSRRRGSGAPNVDPGLVALGATGAGLGLLMTAAATWLVPVSPQVLQFSRSESEFLLPAPVSSRRLLFARLLRSQAGVFFSSLIVTLVVPTPSWAQRVAHFIAGFIVLTTARAFSAGVVLTRARARTASGLERLLVLVPPVATLAAAAFVVVQVVRAVYTLSAFDGPAIAERMNALASSGPIFWILQPVTALTRPWLADTLGAFLIAVPPALGVLGVTVAWVLSADKTFAAMNADGVEATELKPRDRTPRYQVKSAAWTLAPRGRTETVFAWKAAQQMFRTVNRRILIRMIVIAVWAVVAVASMSRTQGLARALAGMTTVFAAIATLFGPQIYRADLRQDLQHLDVLKTWPLRAADVIRGELLWPSAVVSLVVWLLVVMAMILSGSAFTRLSTTWIVAIGFGAMLFAPAVILAQYTVHTALALTFPAWIPTGSSAPRGIDAMGQRIIMLGGTWLTLAIAILPSAILGAILWFLFFPFIGPWVLVPIGAMGTVTTLVEVVLATEALGPLYDRLDIAGVERAE